MVGGVRWGLLEGHIVLHVHASCMNVSMRGALGLFSKRGGQVRGIAAHVIHNLQTMKASTPSYDTVGAFKAFLHQFFFQFRLPFHICCNNN